RRRRHALPFQRLTEAENHKRAKLSYNLLMRTLMACLVLALTATSAFAADSVDTLLNNAYTKAKAEKKNVLVKFSASWCGWCHKMDDFLTKTELGKKVKDQFIV